MDSHGKGHNFTNRFWEMIEAALNDILHDLFVPKKDEFTMRLAHDDDKHWYNETKKLADRPLGEETQRRVLLEWTQCTRSERVTMFMTQRQLKEHAEEFDLAQFMKWSGKVLEQRKRYAAMLESLLYSDEEEETPIETGENAHLIEYLKAWFMPPLKKGSDESRAATHGHRVEKRFLKQAFECIKACIKACYTGASADAIYAPGLVSRRDTMHLRDSADGVVMLTDTEGDLEMKQIEDVRRMMEDDDGLLMDGDDSRSLYAVFDGTIDTAADDDDTSVGNSDSGDRERHYTVNPILRAAIPDANELIQIMHHSVIWAIDTCFFVVGGYSRVLAIYRKVQFPEELIRAYDGISLDLFSK
ncbi:hypothetical protein THAOC_29704 [Thalassiosira oceanica]|uniref:Uncharacterized protein n=1 Tax=Thalassiosira oceanica TaxID=159749 RepID=K0RQN8_THAOC|nr:hypothetical protein THAOC_29704 [Thalassiosira oceanica]|eukprot:EJK51151.1 hypothetical protein THAOC_29704 [Thalassiosira oceanica]